jgi:phosphoglycerate kinase
MAIEQTKSGLKGIKTIRDFELNDKNLFLRLDLNVPLNGTEISDETRIRESLPTIKYAVDKGAKIVMASHLGRPKGPGDKKYSLEPVAKRMSELLGMEVLLVEEPGSEATKALLKGLSKNQILLLENLRYDDRETKNSDELALKWAHYSQVYINDAFGASHRAHASIEALPKLMKDKGIGFLIEKEIQVLDKMLENPQRPFLAVMGGAKVSDKIDVIEKLIDVVDTLIIGGAMAYTFLKAQGHPVGKSLVEADKISYARELISRMEARHKSLLLPVDHLVTANISTGQGTLTMGVGIADDQMGVDIGPKTQGTFEAAIRGAQTIFWNGPMGIFETAAYSKGTFAVAKYIAESKAAMKIVGGGDSAAAAEASGYAKQMTHISTGGGAALEYIQGEKLPGLEVLRVRRESVEAKL